MYKHASDNVYRSCLLHHLSDRCELIDATSERIGAKLLLHSTHQYMICTASVHDVKPQSFDYYVPPNQEEREAEQRRKQRAQESRAQRHHVEKPYSQTGPSHRSTPKEERERSASEAIERLQWQEERPIRKEDAEAKQAAARHAAHERARKKAQKQRGKNALLALADEYEPLAKCTELTIADFVAK